MERLAGNGCLVWALVIVVVIKDSGARIIPQLNNNSATWEDAMASCSQNGQALIQLKDRNCSILDVLGVASGEDIWVGEFYKQTDTWKTLSLTRRIPEKSVEKCGVLSTNTGLTEDRCDKQLSYLCSATSGVYLSSSHVDWLSAATHCSELGFYLANHDEVVNYNINHEDNIWIGHYKEWSYVQGDVDAPDRCLSCLKNGTRWLQHNSVCNTKKIFACEKEIQTTLPPSTQPTHQVSTAASTSTPTEVMQSTASTSTQTEVMQSTASTSTQTEVMQNTIIATTVGGATKSGESTTSPTTTHTSAVSTEQRATGGQNNGNMQTEVIDTTGYIIGLVVEGGFILLLVLGLCLYRSYISGYKRGARSPTEKLDFDTY
ncbi:hypothetical protein ScPMuIL_013064 [Solemya velum]